MSTGHTHVHERLRRLLFLVPFVARHPGLHVAEVAQALSMTREALLEELNLLTLVGRPPFDPDDFIDIYVDDERVYVELDQRLSAPPRMTVAEGVALTTAATLFKPVAGDALARALLKLERVLPERDVHTYQKMAKAVDLTMEAPEGLEVLSRAILQRLEVELEYFTAARGQSACRRVRPYEILSHRGLWYVNAHCLTRGESRLFRVDRIRGCTLTNVHFTAAQPKHYSTFAVRGGAGAGDVRVRFESHIAPWVIERFADAVHRLPDGTVEITVPCYSERWLTQWVLSFGGDAVVVEPQWAKHAVARVANDILRSY